MWQIYRKTPTQEGNFNKIAQQLAKQFCCKNSYLSSLEFVHFRKARYAFSNDSKDAHSSQQTIPDTAQFHFLSAAAFVPTLLVTSQPVGQDMRFQNNFTKLSTMNKSQFVNWYMSCLVSNSKFYPEISDAQVEVIYVVKKKKPYFSIIRMDK